MLIIKIFLSKKEIFKQIKSYEDQHHSERPDQIKEGKLNLLYNLLEIHITSDPATMYNYYIRPWLIDPILADKPIEDMKLELIEHHLLPPLYNMLNITVGQKALNIPVNSIDTFQIFKENFIDANQIPTLLLKLTDVYDNSSHEINIILAKCGLELIELYLNSKHKYIINKIKANLQGVINDKYLKNKDEYKNNLLEWHNALNNTSIKNITDKLNSQDKWQITIPNNSTLILNINNNDYKQYLNKTLSPKEAIDFVMLLNNEYRKYSNITDNEIARYQLWILQNTFGNIVKKSSSTNIDQSKQKELLGTKVYDMLNKIINSNSNISLDSLLLLSAYLFNLKTQQIDQLLGILGFSIIIITITYLYKHDAIAMPNHEDLEFGKTDSNLTQ